LFDITTGLQLSKWLGSDTAPFDEFARSVSISGNRAIVGSYFDDDGGSESGSAYLFAAVPEPTSLLLATLVGLFGLARRRNLVGRR